MILKRLGVAAIVFATGGITHVPDRRITQILLHQRFSLRIVRQPKNLLDAAQFSIGVDQLPVGRIGDISRHARRKLASVLHVQQHPDDQSRRVASIVAGAKFADLL